MPLSIREFEALARDRLPADVYDFVAGGAEDEVTLRANESAFGRLRLLPRVLRGPATRELGVSLLGMDATMPVLIAPTAFHRLAHPEGEKLTARAAAAAGAIMIVSMGSTVAIEDIADAGGQSLALWFQLYVQPDWAVTEALVRRAERAGCRALVVTVDLTVFGRRERDHRNGFHDLPEGLHCENLRGIAGERGVRQIESTPELSWEHIDRLRATTALPIVLKGLMHPLDAVMAVGHGVSGVIVSNHGGRQLDTAMATIDALPDVAEAVNGRIPVLLDGGVRRGTDVVKALALGASAVAVGRPVIWGLAVAGAAGVTQVLELLRDETDRALGLCGCACLHEVTRDLVQAAPC
ncbi:alpha-hydroxy acid oxidase [Actinocrispum wychmicini]|uniref:4-hydroxymandelate oxidase n=1 Tax=Actinocrispum wychmicini TaxID=1213861 RepID=A0A4R2IVU2_9PSEU|nr:alpha-hydroxy acid oxidase [Actinocrispum wychmicini]TCO49823.1 4-hydroxymandelate oxidase [Actinocrispum wychmicini]